jgi:hypothetical protein
VEHQQGETMKGITAKYYKNPDDLIIDASLTIEGKSEAHVTVVEAFLKMLDGNVSPLAFNQLIDVLSRANSIIIKSHHTMECEEDITHICPISSYDLVLNVDVKSSLKIS